MAEPFHEASILVAPPDDCPHCKAERIHAYATSAAMYTANEIIGYYRCGDCNHFWERHWRIEPVTPTSQDHLHD